MNFVACHHHGHPLTLILRQGRAVNSLLVKPGYRTRFKWQIIKRFFDQMDGFNIQLFPDTYVMHHALFVSSSIPQLNQCLESLTTWTSWGVTFIINFQCQFMYNHFTTIKWYESFKFQKISSGDFFIILVALIFNVNIYMQESTIHGIRYFVDGENILHRAVWMVLVAISVSLLSYLIFDATMYI